MCIYIYIQTHKILDVLNTARALGRKCEWRTVMTYVRV